MRPGRWLATIAAVAGCGAAAVWSVRAGLADYWGSQETVAGTERAIALTPGQALYHYRLAVLLADDNPHKSTAALNDALKYNPADPDSWIEQGLRLEAAGKYSQAEGSLLRAAEVSNLYLPRWTLANYYFRRGDTVHFWQWANRAAEMIYGDPTPLFDLSERVAENGDLSAELEFRNPDFRGSYLSYLMARGETNWVAANAEALLRAGPPSDTPLLLASCDLLLDGKQVDPSLRIWNRLAAARQIPFSALDLNNGPFLTNTIFAISPTSHGFDWRLASLEGVSAAREEEHGGLRLSFNGNQPEQCEPLTQLVPVREKGAYELRFSYWTSGIAPDAGPRWQVADAFGSRVLAESEALSSQEAAEGRVSFETPGGCRLLRLALVYRRAPGTTRIDGFVVLREVRLDRQPK
jgi:hypothetical protein